MEGEHSARSPHVSATAHAPDVSGSAEMERPMAPHSVDDLARSFERHLRPGNKSPRTIETYLQAVDQFAAHLRANRKANGGRGLADARGEDVEAFVVALLERHKPATASNRYRGLHAFYRWLEDEEEIPHPMRKLKPPVVPDQPVPVIGEPQLRRLLAVCAGKDFEARRDTAIILLLIDAGPRRSEFAGMRLDAVDCRYHWVRPLGSQLPPLPAELERLVLPSVPERSKHREFRPELPGHPYGRKVLEQELASLAAAPRGTRNHALYQAGIRLYSLIAGGVLDSAEVEAGLRSAAEASRLLEEEPAQIRRTLASAER